MDDARSTSFAGSVAEAYDTFLSPYLFEPWAARIMETAKLAEGAAVLDVASGTGALARASALAVGPSGRVVASDISADMLARSRARPRQPQAAPIEHLQCSAQDIDAPDATFDAVLCQQGLQFFPDPQQALAEMRRVARPGATVVAAVWSAEAELGLFGSMIEVAVDLDLPEPFPGAFQPLTYCLTAVELRRLFDGAGLGGCHVTTLVLEAVWPNAAVAARAVGGTPYGPTFAALPEAGRRAGELLAQKFGTRADGTVMVRTTSHLVRANR